MNKIFEQAIEGAEQEGDQVEDDDDDNAARAPIANMLMMIVARLFFYIKLEWLDEVEVVESAKKKARASAGAAVIQSVLSLYDKGFTGPTLLC